MSNGNVPRHVAVAVIGTGSAGTRHIQALRRIPNVSVCAVPARAARIPVLQEQGIGTAEHVREAAANGCRLAIVATTTSRHVDDTLQAIDAGLDVLVEKPMATDAAQAEQVRRAGERRSRSVYVGCVLRFSESLNACRAVLGHVGRIHDVRIECQSYLPEWRPLQHYRSSYSARPAEGGVVLDLIHELDYAGWLFGWPTAVQGHVRNLGRLGIASEEAADLLWDAPTGPTVSIRLDYLTRPARRRMRISGEFGTIEWDGVKQTTVVTMPDAPAQTLASTQSRDDMFLEQATAFVNASAAVRDARLPGIDDGIRALALSDAVKRASEQGTTARVAYS